MEGVPASRKELLSRIENAGLLEKCGGPYPDEKAISPVPTLHEALNIIGGSQLDATPHCGWDRQVVAALRECAAKSRKQKGVLAWLLASRSMYEERRRLFDRTREKVEVWGLNAGLSSPDRVVVSEHLADLFSTTASLLDAEIASTWPLILEATRYALSGYLSVDFTSEDGIERVLIF